MLVKKKIKVPIYGEEVIVIIYDDPVELKKILKDKISDIPEEIYDGWVYQVDGIIYCVLYVLEKPRYPTPGVIAHEAKHVVNNIFINIGHELDRYNDEPEAYLLGWVVNRIYEIKNTFYNAVSK